VTSDASDTREHTRLDIEVDIAVDGFPAVTSLENRKETTIEFLTGNTGYPNLRVGSISGNGSFAIEF
jgi:hypothetical protein